jgi:hypothetical protein
MTSCCVIVIQLFQKQSSQTQILLLQKILFVFIIKIVVFELFLELLTI